MTTPSYETVRAQVARRYRRLSWFVLHVVMAITSVIAIWLIDPTPEDGTPVIALLWFGLLVFHAIKIYMSGMEDRAVERMWERYQGDADFDEKPKRMMRLTDDAELEVIEDDPVQGNNRLSSLR